MLTTILAQVLLLGLASASSSCLPSSPTASVGEITVYGSRCEHIASNAFLGIPYAMPPLGYLRFMDPQPLKLSQDLNATKQPPHCLQFGFGLIEPYPQSEDCLFLNIYAPNDTNSGSRLPVKAWIHGGGNTAGGIANPLYDGCEITTDAIVVTINYRLGPLGFLALEAAGLEGNYGIKDQLLALQWIQDNIESFGGDPTKVLLFGESAGAYDVWAISTLPQARSLFSAVITESGGGADLPTFAQVQDYNEQLVKAFGCRLLDLECIQGLNTTTMNDTLVGLAQKATTVSLSLLTNDNTGNGGTPAIDGRTIPRQPRIAGAQVPAIFGTNSMEGTIFFGLSGVPPASFNETAYNTFIDHNFGPWATDVKTRYPLSQFSAEQYPVYTAMSSIATDFYFKCSAHRALQASAANHISAYTYVFNITPSCPWDTYVPNDLTALGATHTAEIPFVFEMTDHLPRPNGNCSFTPQEVETSRFVVKAWTSMASQQKPGTVNAWPAWTEEQSMGLVIDQAFNHAGRIDYTICSDFWDEISLKITALSQNGGS